MDRLTLRNGPDALVRHDWTREEVTALHALPLPELVYRAQTIHRQFFDPTEIETASLLSIKTGGCPEDCGYCSQSVHHQTGLKASKLMDRDDVIAQAVAAKAAGAGRFCMGAAWRNPNDRDLARVCTMIEGVKALGLQTCATLGMLTEVQAERLKDAGLDYYSHNIDTSPEYYGEIITTRTLQDRLDTIAHVRAAGIKVCCGGIVGMGESAADRLGMLLLLANLTPHPESVPLNMWSEVAGTPVMATAEKPDPIDFARLVATARILMPASIVRLSAGRRSMSEELQGLCFIAGANSIFIGDILLTTRNAAQNRDAAMLAKLGMRTRPESVSASAAYAPAAPLPERVSPSAD